MPPYITETDKVILFDGMCVLCSAWSRFILKYDKSYVFKLATVQSIEGREILKWFNMPTDYYETMLYVEGNKEYKKSDAFLKIIGYMPLPWKMLIILRIIPRFIRDWMYDRIALNRYKLFGKYDTCIVPSEKDKKRFL